MYFSRITLRGNARQSSDFWRVFQSPYTLHQSIWKIFSDHADRRRDFLYRLDKDRQSPLIYAISTRVPTQSRDIWNIESKSYTPQIKAGSQLSFMLRVNPVVSKRDINNKQHRHDVVMDLKKRLKEQKIPPEEMPTITAIAQETGWGWLAARSESNGFSVRQDQIRADGYRHECFVKKGGRKISYSTLDFTGELTVTDSKLFLDTLYKGIGPVKAFGCGLMLIKRI